MTQSMTIHVFSQLSQARKTGIISWSSLIVLIAWGVVTVAKAEETEGLPIAKLDRTEPVDFSKEILPILRRNCLACHNSTDAESDLVLETPETIIKGGGEGPSIVPGESQESYLLQVATHRKEPVMPPEDNDVGATNLTPEELALIQRWIDEGAKGQVVREKIQWQEIPQSVTPILSSAVTEKGDYVACGRANKLFVYHVPSGKLVQELFDPSLSKDGSSLNKAHLDLIRSLAFHPDGNLLASGGFRTVKLWRRGSSVPISKVTVNTSVTATSLAADGHGFATGHADGSIRYWTSQETAKPVVLAGTAEVTALTFSSDNKQLFVATKDQTLHGWHLETNQVTDVVKATSDIRNLVMRNNGKFLVTAGPDHVIRVWKTPLATADAADAEKDKSAEAQPAKLVRELQGHTREVSSLAAVPQTSNQLVSGSIDGTLRIWDVNDGQQLRQFIHGSGVVSVAIRPDGKRLTSSGDNKAVNLWNAEDGSLIRELTTDQAAKEKIERVDRFLAVTRQLIDDQKKILEEAGKTIASREEEVKKAKEEITAADKNLTAKTEAVQKSEQAQNESEQSVASSTVKRDQAAKGKEQAQKQLDESKTSVQEAVDRLAKNKEALADQLGQEELIKALEDAIRVFMDVAVKQEATATTLIAKFDQEHKAAEQTLEIANKQLEDNKKKAETAKGELTSAEQEKKTAGRKLEDGEDGVKRANENKNEQETRLASYEQRVETLQRQLNELHQWANQLRNVSSMAQFSFDSTRLVIADDQGTAHLFDAEDGTTLIANPLGNTPLRGFFATSNGTIVSVDDQNQIAVWNTEPKWVLEQTIGNVDAPDVFIDRVLALDFSEDGKLLATGSGEPSRSGELKIWRVEDGQLVHTMKDAHSDTIFGLDFSLDGQYIASAAADRFVKTFRVDDGSFVRGFEGHTHHVLDVTWQAKGRQLASAGADQVIKIWDFETGEQKRTISGFGKEVTAVSFMGTGTSTLSSSGDKSVRIHDTNNGNVIRTLAGADDFLFTVSASIDGTNVVAGGQSGVLRLWNGNDGKLVNSLEPPKINDK